MEPRRARGTSQHGSSSRCRGSLFGQIGSLIFQKNSLISSREFPDNFSTTLGATH